jgi:hypothetical protein
LETSFEWKGKGPVLIIVLLQARQLASFVLNIIPENNDPDFGDLGKLMIGGFALAVVLAVAFTFVRLRLRDRKPQATAEFLSINSFQRKK